MRRQRREAAAGPAMDVMPVVAQRRRECVRPGCNTAHTHPEHSVASPGSSIYGNVSNLQSYLPTYTIRRPGRFAQESHVVIHATLKVPSDPVRRLAMGDVGRWVIVTLVCSPT